MAETEISLWGRECLGGRRIPCLKDLKSETAAWNRRANRLRRKITGHLTSQPLGKSSRFRSLTDRRRTSLKFLAVTGKFPL
jgi:hypothetical protein